MYVNDVGIMICKCESEAHTYQADWEIHLVEPAYCRTHANVGRSDYA